MSEAELPPEEQLKIIEKELERVGIEIDTAERTLLQEHGEAARLYLHIRELYLKSERLSYELGRVGADGGFGGAKREDAKDRPEEERHDPQWPNVPGTAGAARVPPEMVARHLRERGEDDLDWLRGKDQAKAAVHKRERVDDIDWLRGNLKESAEQGRPQERDRYSR